MSMDSQAIQQLLMQRLQQPGTQGGGPGNPQMQGTMTPGNAAAQIMQKVMLMKALQSRQNQQQANAMLPGTNAQIAQNPSMLALQQPTPMQPMQANPVVAPPQPPPSQ